MALALRRALSEHGAVAESLVARAEIDQACVRIGNAAARLAQAREAQAAVRPAHLDEVRPTCHDPPVHDPAKSDQFCNLMTNFGVLVGAMMDIALPGMADQLAAPLSGEEAPPPPSRPTPQQMLAAIAANRAPEVYRVRLDALLAAASPEEVDALIALPARHTRRIPSLLRPLTDEELAQCLATAMDGDSGLEQVGEQLQAILETIDRRMEQGTGQSS